MKYCTAKIAYRRRCWSNNVCLSQWMLKESVELVLSSLQWNPNDSTYASGIIYEVSEAKWIAIFARFLAKNGLPAHFDACSLSWRDRNTDSRQWPHKTKLGRARSSSFKSFVTMRWAHYFSGRVESGYVSVSEKQKNFFRLFSRRE